MIATSESEPGTAGAYTLLEDQDDALMWVRGVHDKPHSRAQQQRRVKPRRIAVPFHAAGRTVSPRSPRKGL